MKQTKWRRDSLSRPRVQLWLTPPGQDLGFSLLRMAYTWCTAMDLVVLPLIVTNKPQAAAPFEFRSQLGELLPE